MNVVNTNYISSKDMINELKSLKTKTKLKIYKNISNFNDEMNIRIFEFEEELFSKNAQDISKNYPEVKLLMKFLQTKPQVKNMNNIYYDFYYTVIKDRDEKEIVDDQYENVENDYNKYEAFIIPNHNISIQRRERILK